MTEKIDQVEEKEVQAPLEGVSEAEAAAPSEAQEQGMQEKDIKTISKKQTVGKVFAKIGVYTFLTIVAISMLFPFYWMLVSSVKSVEEYNALIPTLWPQHFRWANYADVFNIDETGIDIGKMFLNTVIVGVVSTILSLIITVLSAYAFARMEFKGKNILFGAMLATMMIPGELFTITNYLTVNAFGWLNTYTALIAPFLVSVFYIYLLRQNFMQIPNELYLAAKVDGTSDFKYLWKVMIPLSAPTLISITILKMMGAWNSYIWPRLVNTDPQLITVGLRELANALTRDPMHPNFPAQMAAVVLVTIPLLLVFMFFRKYIMRGVSRSGLKG